MIPLDAVPVPVESFIVRRVGEETIFLSAEGDEIHVLNPVGTYIWSAIDGSRPLRSILESLCADYEVAPAAAGRDLAAFMEEMTGKGLLRMKRDLP